MDLNVSQLIKALNTAKIGGKTAVVSVTGAQVGVSGAAYSSGDVIGDQSPIEVELVQGEYGTGIIQTVITKDLSNQSAAIDLFVFSSRPTGTYTDNSAMDVSDADAASLIGVINIVATDYAASADSSFATTRSIGLVIKNMSGTNKVWFIPVSRGTPTYVADELSFTFGVLQD